MINYIPDAPNIGIVDLSSYTHNPRKFYEISTQFGLEPTSEEDPSHDLFMEGKSLSESLESKAQESNGAKTPEMSKEMKLYSLVETDENRQYTFSDKNTNNKLKIKLLNESGYFRANTSDGLTPLEEIGPSQLTSMFSTIYKSGRKQFKSQNE